MSVTFPKRVPVDLSDEAMLRLDLCLGYIKTAKNCGSLDDERAFAVERLQSNARRLCEISDLMRQSIMWQPPEQTNNEL